MCGGRSAVKGEGGGGGKKGRRKNASRAAKHKGSKEDLRYNAAARSLPSSPQKTPSQPPKNLKKKRTFSLFQYLPNHLPSCLSVSHSSTQSAGQSESAARL
jgi:hypothetical protein